MKNQFRALTLLLFILPFVFTACNGSVGVDVKGGNLIFTPSAPGAATVTAAESQLALTWASISDATYYEVWYNTVNNSATSTQSGGNISTTSYTLPGLTNGTLYYVWLKAKNSAGTSGFGAVASGKPVLPLSPPIAPGMASITAGNTQLSLSWSAVTGATYYTVWYNTIDDSSTATQKGGDISLRNYTITGLTNGTLYYVWLKAKNSSGTSGFSPVASGTPFLAVPSSPGSATVIPGSSQLSISWSYVSGATAYEVWYGTSSNSDEASKFGSDLTIRSTVITGLINSTLYYIWIKAKNSAGTSGFGTVASGTPVIGVPSSPDKATLIPGNSQLSLSWSAVADATDYEVWYNSSDIPGTATKFGSDVSGTSTTITGLINGITYYVWLKAKNSSGTSGFGTVASATSSALRTTGPAGGIIFYDRGSYIDGWRYMEVAPASTEWASKQWGASGTKIGGTSQEIGTGQANTTIIVTWLNNNSESDRAAQLCDALNFGGYDDWFLPSHNEINRMHQNLRSGSDQYNVTFTPVGSFVEFGNYWSSSEFSYDNAWAWLFTSGSYPALLEKIKPYYVRAVRVF